MSRRDSGLPNVVLAGFMGTGKSTVGALVASELDWPCVDTDSLIEKEVGMPVREIFATHGEPAFRALEQQACAQAAGRREVVVSVGGGAVLDTVNRRALESSGVVVLLICERDTLVERLQESARRGERPLLGEGLGDSIDTLLRARKAVYSLIPLRVDTTHLTIGEAAKHVLALYYQAIRGRVPA